MKRKGDIEEDIELREEEDELGGDDVPAKKREKKGKTKEQKAKERVVIFWTMVIVLLATAVFWIMPLVSGKDLRKGREILTPTKQEATEENYVKYEL